MQLSRAAVRIFTIYAGVFLIFTAVYLALFHLPPFLTDVFFYRGLLYLGLTVLLFAFALAAYASRTGYRRTESLIAALSVAASVNLAAFVVFPVTFDRSLTMFLLHTLASERTATKSELSQQFIGTYFLTHDALGKRLHEQSVAGMIGYGNGTYSLTDRARLFLRISDVIGTVYGLR